MPGLQGLYCLHYIGFTVNMCRVYRTVMVGIHIYIYVYVCIYIYIYTYIYIYIFGVCVGLVGQNV